MDCCNYMQYRHHQPYYGSQCYDPLPYHGDFYGQQVYQEYYANSYYPQQWPCAASFPDYVYNPKEARIRKAMRDATRERSIGTSPMFSRPNARRASHSWVSPHEDLIMSPQGGMRGPLQPSMGFPLPSPGNQFMDVMNGYSKLEPPPMPSSAPVHPNYMQANPLAQLQQHTEMWPDYQMRSRPPGNPYMMPEGAVYHQPEIASPLLLKQPPPPCESAPLDPKEPEPMEPPHPERFLPVFEGSDVDARNPFENPEDAAKMKKPPAPQIRNVKRPASKPLPDFNEAFGSTERGRFQSPPDPRLAPNKGYMDYLFESTPIKFDDYQI